MLEAHPNDGTNPNLSGAVAVNGGSGKPARKRRGIAKLLLEERAFLAQQDELRKTYPGQFVAIHEGRVVDADPDEFVLDDRIEDKYPEEAILIRPSDWVEEILEISTPFRPGDR